MSTGLFSPCFAATTIEASFSGESALMSAPQHSLPTTAADSTVRLLTRVSATVVPATHEGEFGTKLAQAICDEIADAVVVYLLAPANGPNRIATVGDESTMLATEMLDVADDIFTHHRPTGGLASVSSKPVGKDSTACWLTAWMYSSGTLCGCVVALANVADPLAKINALQQLKLATELASRFLERNEVARKQSTSALHRSLDLKETSHTVANELRSQMGVDRVSVFLRHGSKLRLQSISGQSRFNGRSNAVRMLRALVDCSVRMGESFCYPTDAERPPQIETALQAYLDESHAQAVRIVPLPEQTKSGGSLGALAFESFQHSAATHESIIHSPAIEEAAVAIHNARTHSEIFMLPLWRSLGRGLGKHPILKLAAAATVAAISAGILYFVQADYQVHASGTLRPLHNQRLFAASDGIVSDIFVAHGQNVARGDELLQLTNAELDQRTDKLLGEVQVAQQQLAALATMRLRSGLPGNAATSDQRPNASIAAEQRQLEAQIANLSEQHEILKQQIERLTVVAPIAGQIVTWDVERQLRSRPVNRGELLVTLEDTTGPWKLELNLPESQVQALLDAHNNNGQPLPVRFVLGTNPDQYHEATLSSVANRAQRNENGELFVRLEASVPDDLALERRVGADVRAKIPCGRYSLGYVLFHDAVDFVRTRVLFYFN